MSKLKSNLKYILLLQLSVLIYTVPSIIGKLAANYEMFSFYFFAFYILEAAILGIYAIFWQQIIKHIDLSVAYANKSTALIWSLLWAVLIFKDVITISNIMGILLVLIGVYLINTESVSKEAVHDK